MGLNAYFDKNEAINWRNYKTKMMVSEGWDKQNDGKEETESRREIRG